MSWHINPLNSLAQGSIVSPDGHGKKQVEQVWVTPSYDVRGSGVCDGVIKHNPTAQKLHLGLLYYGRQTEEILKAPAAQEMQLLPLLGYRLIRMCLFFS